MKLSYNTLLSFLAIIILFIGAEILARLYTEDITSFVLFFGMWGMVFFALTSVLAVLIPLWSNIFLLPLVVPAWGPFVTALLCITGWWLGSILAFAIGRYAHTYILRRHPSFMRHQHLDRLISKKYPLLSLIFLRMTLPVDILSYALGLFGHKITAKENAITSLIGIAPFAFLFAYLSMVHPVLQILTFVVTSSLFVLYLIYIKYKQ